uniref:Phytochrome n=1 Tax=Rhizophora mucronata TaxID=61149 RepID=A0A2P2QSE1_RHIMU
MLSFTRSLSNPESQVSRLITLSQ